MLTSDEAALRAFLARVVNRAAARLGLSHIVLTQWLDRRRRRRARLGGQ